jgi:peptide/nickel transport system permease protein
MSMPELQNRSELALDVQQEEAAKAPSTARGTDLAGFWSRFLRKPLGAAGLALVLVVVALALLAPWVARYDPIATDLANPLASPSLEHWLGTDSLGRDTWSRMVWGARPTLLYAIEPVVVSLTIGIPIGLIAGHFGGGVDRMLMWLTDIGLALPGVVLLLIVLSMFSSQFWIAMAFFGALAAVPLVRFVRGATLNVRREPFIDSALVAGRSHGYVIRRHIFPRIRGLLLVQVTLLTAGGVMLMAGMGYLGYGPKPPTPTWGSMMTDAQTAMATSPWLLIVSGGITGLTVLSLGLVGDAVRDASVEAWAHFPTRPPRRPTPSLQPAVTDSDKLSPSSGLLVVNGLSVSFERGGNPVPILDGVSFAIRPGERVALVGESGCGKSTAASAVVRLLPGNGAVTAGSVTFDGEDVLGLSGRDLRSYRGSSVGYVSQEPIAALDPAFKIGFQLAEAIRAHQPSHPDVRGRVRELLAMVRIPDVERVARSHPHELSGGMAQRVSIARALAGNPRLLIADEPTTALDVTVQAEILGLLLTLAQENDLAILLISHHWGVVSQLCTRAVVMYAGQVVEQGPVAELLTRAAHPYTRGLLRCRPSAASRGAGELPVIPGSVPDPEAWARSCRFADRCSMATDLCRKGPVPEVAVAAGHESRCRYATQLLEEVRDAH